jgi:dTDP-4-amino-4,6-dideoxygalactose transaminase
MKYPLSIPHLTANALEQEFLAEAVRENQISSGRFIGLLENSVKELTGAQNALAVVNGTSAIHLALLALGVERGDEVLVSAFTFIGSVSPVMYIGAVPVFIDSEKNTWNMDANLLEDELAKRASSGRKIPKYLILTHIYGQAADMDAICSVCDRYGVILIEDAAESLGATYAGRHTGTFGAAGIYSFNANKVITSGGGGVLVSGDKNIISRAAYLANQAKEPCGHYEHTTIGYNYRTSNLHCAFGYAQMLELKSRIQRKREIADLYKTLLKGCPVEIMPEHKDAVGSRWLTAVIFEDGDRESIADYLCEEGAETRPLWKPMHLQPVFKDAEAVVNGVSEELFEYGLCLPSNLSLSDEDIADICCKIIRIL